MEEKYNHLKAEADAQQLWHKHNVYSTDANPGPFYSIDTPPPTVSGSLHIGHIFSYTQTDIIARYARMQGNSVFYPFGFDDNGLPTEKYVEKKLSVNGHEMKRSEFIALCLKETKDVEKTFEDLWRRIGLSVDWNACYSTIDDRSRYISQLSFIELHKKGHIYRKNEPALYCTTCRTTVAQAELDDIEKNTTFNDLIFKSGNTDLIIATTRPELLAATKAVFYHPGDIRYQHLKGKTATVPYYKFEVPILADELVDPEKGTGLVMFATFGDKTDVLWFKKHNLSYTAAIGLDGKFTKETGPLEGMRVATARQTILDLLEQEGSLVKKEPHISKVNVHERCKKEIEYLVLPQWFLAIMPHKETFIQLGEKIRWYPAFMKSRYSNWVENVSWDWCLSRQRFYGIPFPAWHCTECSTIILATPDQLPVDPQETAYKGTCSCGSSSFTGDTDVMDTWNTSSLTPYICASLRMPLSENILDDAAKEFIPMTIRPQAHDIIRTWAFDTIIKVWMHNSTIPWKDIIISGHVLSDAKEKLSKSKGNSALTPENLLENYPADAIRFWTASGNLGHDISFSENQLLIGRKLLVKLWNAFRFIEPYRVNLSDPKPTELGIANQWILDSTTTCFVKYGKYFTENEFSLALQTVEQFFWHDFCDNYLEIIKNQLLNPEQYTPEEVQATKWTLTQVGMRILQLYGPFVPHVTETLYGELYKEQAGVLSLHMTKFKQYQNAYSFDQAAKTMSSILEIISQVRKLKSEQQLSLKTDLSELVITVSDESLVKQLQDQTPLIKGVTRAHTIAVVLSKEAQPSTLIQIQDSWQAHVTL
jgi:valyl-tRNA synthetase